MVTKTQNAEPSRSEVPSPGTMRGQHITPAPPRGHTPQGPSLCPRWLHHQPQGRLNDFHVQLKLWAYSRCKNNSSRAYTRNLFIFYNPPRVLGDCCQRRLRYGEWLTIDSVRLRDSAFRCCAPDGRWRFKMSAKNVLMYSQNPGVKRKQGRRRHKMVPCPSSV